MKKRDKAKAIDDLVEEIEAVLDAAFDPVSLANGVIDGNPIRGWAADLLKVRSDTSEAWEAIYGAESSIDLEAAVNSIRAADEGAMLITGYLLGQARAGVPMGEIQRQARAMLDRE